MKTKLQSLGFTTGHAHLLLVAVAVFAFLIVAKTDVNLKALFVNADDEQVMLTFDGVRSEVEKQYGEVSEEISTEEEEQLALLDRTFDQGQVLGDDIGVGTIPNVSELYSSQQLNAIQVHSVVASNKQNVQQYADRMLRIESFYNTTTMFSNLNSSDPETIKSTFKQTGGIIESMKEIPVPSELVDYHRYNVIYYQTLYAIGNSFITGEGDLGSYTKTLFSLMNKINAVKSEINNKYQIEL